MVPSGKRTGGGGNLLPILALLAAQIFTSSWHVLGKHVMHQVPYLAPISFVLIRTIISSTTLLLIGIIHEGYVSFPALFRRTSTTSATSSREVSLQMGLLKPSTSSGILSTSASIESGSSLGLPLSQSNSRDSLNALADSGNDDKVELFLPQKQHRHHHRPRRKKPRRHPSFRGYVSKALCSAVPSMMMLSRNIQFTLRHYQQQMNNLNPEAVQIIFAGLTGMLLLPTCYTTGLILTSPTVASVWDGPMIPLGCFCAAVALGLEKRSKHHPFGQVGSLLLTVGGSIVVLLVDYLGGHNVRGDDERGKDGVNAHMQFIQGNTVLMGVVAAYSATALLQKQLTRFPPLQLTAWMFGIGHVGCLTLLMLDSILGSRLTGCSLGQSLRQLYLALHTSPTFLYGLLYSAFFVGGASFSIGSYASSHLESSVITLFAAMQPPITAVLEWIWEGKQLGWKKLVGMLCVGIGMWFFTHIKRMEKGIVDGGSHGQRKQGGKDCVPLRKAQNYENGDHKVSRSIGGAYQNNTHGSPNLTNRKTHADV